MGKLVGRLKYDKKLKDNILFKEGDKGDKFYIILKGEVGILIKQERAINCTPMEYFKYLMVLYLYQERSMLYNLSCNVKDYIQRLCCKEIPKLIKKDIKNFFCQNI